MNSCYQLGFYIVCFIVQYINFLSEIIYKSLFSIELYEKSKLEEIVTILFVTLNMNAYLKYLFGNIY